MGREAGVALGAEAEAGAWVDGRAGETADAGDGADDFVARGGIVLAVMFIVLLVFSFWGGGEKERARGEDRCDGYVPYADGVFGRTPAGTEGAEVGEADTAVGDGYVDVGFFPGFGGEGTPGEGGGGGVGEPAVEGCGGFGFVWFGGERGCAVGWILRVLSSHGDW